jgi:hypothetical protein
MNAPCGIPFITQIRHWKIETKSLYFHLMRSILIAVLTAPFLIMADDFVFEANYDEAKIPAYSLPDVLEGVDSADGWPAKRAEWHALIAREMFGETTETMRATKATMSPAAPDKAILDGKGILKQITVKLAGQDINVAIFLPKSAKEEAVPVFLGYNFSGNHTVFDDPDIVLTKSWMRKRKDQQANAEDRGKSASRWCVERIIDGGFGLVTVYYGDVDPDFDDQFENGVHAELGVPAKNEAASIASWSWALSRILDVLTDSVSEVDGEKVAVFGHSRLGKTSLWAGASDERFALVISNNSGCGGAALSRRAIGETVWRINNSFPHWFCQNFKRYDNKEGDLPFDNHTLLALIAPRPLYVASAEGDTWADPKGEFLSCLHADPVYQLLGTEGLPATEMPKVNTPVQGRIGYHIRSGDHNVTDYDWEQYVAFATKHLLP